MTLKKRIAAILLLIPFLLLLLIALWKLSSVEHAVPENEIMGPTGAQLHKSSLIGAYSCSVLKIKEKF